MRLTCPRCGAQYEIAQAAIPAAGREVECSACSHVWHQPGTDEGAAPYDPAARPTLNRPLNESILSVLREETARELRAREGTAAEPADGSDRKTANAPTDRDAAALPTSDKASDGASASARGGWPATTLTHDTDESAAPAARNHGTTPPPPAAGDTQPPAPARPEPASPAASGPAAPPVAPALPDAAALAATLTRSDPPPAEPSHTNTAAETAATAATAAPTEAPAHPADEETAPDTAAPASAPQTAPEAALAAAPVATRRGSGYATGFGLAAMLALGVIAVYALAPRVSADGYGGVLVEWRQDIDRGRLWLHDRIIGPPANQE